MAETNKVNRVFATGNILIVFFLAFTYLYHEARLDAHEQIMLIMSDTDMKLLCISMVQSYKITNDTEILNFLNEKCEVEGEPRFVESIGT